MSRSRLWVWASLAGTLGFGAVSLPFMRTMDDHGVSLTDYQLARTPERAAELNAALGADGLDAVTAGLWWDYPFLVCFFGLVALLCSASARRAARLGRTRLAAAGRLFTLAAIVAGSCDALEDAVLLQVADGETGDPWPALAFAFASTKFALLIVCVAYLITASLHRGSRSSG